MFRRILISVAAPLAALVVATPALAQPTARPSNPAASTEAKGYAAISKAIATGSRSLTPVDLAGRTEAKGYAAISKAIAAGSRSVAPVDLAGQTEAKGYSAISKAIAQPRPLATSVNPLPSQGFSWSDAGIGAAAGAGFVLLLFAATMLVRHARTEPQPA